MFRKKIFITFGPVGRRSEISFSVFYVLMRYKRKVCANCHQGKDDWIGMANMIVITEDMMEHVDKKHDKTGWSDLWNCNYWNYLASICARSYNWEKFTNDAELEYYLNFTVWLWIINIHTVCLPQGNIFWIYCYLYMYVHCTF